jgi:hypothetical protein
MDLKRNLSQKKEEIAMNGKGDKQRVRWSKDFAKRFNLIFNNKEKKTHGRHDNNLLKK